MSEDDRLRLQTVLADRFIDAPNVGPDIGDAQSVLGMASRGSCRHFLDREVPREVLDLLCATALASPTKSDLQQRDIVLLCSEDKRRALADLVAGQTWVQNAPMLIVFCGNNRRQRLLHEWTGIPFANDHLDAFFNAVADAAIALGAFVTAAEALGLGCCPISAIRNEAKAVKDMLKLPQHSFPVAGLAVGYPRFDARISQRLPLSVTCHVDEYDETNLRENVEAYAQKRAKDQGYSTQRDVEIYGETPGYSWIDDKTRQYSHVERGDFGDFVRAQGFQL